MSIDIDVKTAKIGFWHMPRTFYVILFIEFWERFAFYGVQSIAILYIYQTFSITPSDSSLIFYSFNSLLYGFLVLGGIIGDKLLGLHRSYVIGLIFFILGYGLLCLTKNPSLFYLSLGFIIVGNIYFKVNSSNYVSRIFETNDPRLDSAFNYFYMLVNVGSFVGIILLSIVSKVYGYHTGVTLGAVGIIIALICYIIFYRRFQLSDNQVGKKHDNKKRLTFGVLVISLVVSYLFSLLLPYESLTQIIFYILVCAILLTYLIKASKLHKNESQGMYLALILLLQAVVFWVLYMQLFNSLFYLSRQSIDLNFMGYELPKGFIRAFNPLFIIIMSPILAIVYERFHAKSIDILIPTKFAYGMLMLSISFFLLGVMCSYAVTHDTLLSVGWLFFVIGFYSGAELLIIAVGPSMVAKLLPKRMGGYAQAIWYLTCAVGINIGTNISQANVLYQYNFIAKSLINFKHFCYVNSLITIIITFVVFLVLKQLNAKMRTIMERK